MTDEARVKEGASSRVVMAVALVVVVIVGSLAVFEYAHTSDLQAQDRSLASSVSELQAENQDFNTFNFLPIP